MRMPRAGTLRNLYVRHNSAAGPTSGPLTYTVFVNNVATAITIVGMLTTVVSPTPGGSSSPVAVVVAQGDDVAIQVKNLGAAAGVDSMVTLELA